MTVYVADTHALYWHLTASTRLGAAAVRAFDEGTRGEARILIHAIVLAELFWILAKQGKASAFAEVIDSLRTAAQFTLIDLHCDDLGDLVADASVPEMHDRIIVGVARRRGAVLLTRDAAIIRSGRVSTAW